MTFFMSRFKDETYALMRFFTGALFLWHGTQKLFGFPLGFVAAPWVSEGPLTTSRSDQHHASYSL